MKHIGSCSDFMEHRDVELQKAFAAELNKRPSVEGENIYVNVVKQPCSRFWVSELRATEVVAKMRKGEGLPENTLLEKRRMYEEIYARVEREMDGNPNQPLIRAVENVVWNEAPEFYMSGETARKNIRRILAAIKTGRRK